MEILNPSGGLTAARLIELLAQHIAEHGNVPVMLPNRPHHYCSPLVRCWWDDDAKLVMIESI